MSASAYVTWFFAVSCAGWLFESAYSVVRTGHWEKRGFLYGPFCPIYGVGAVAGLLLFDRPEVASGAFPAWGVFLASMAGSAVLEYGVSVTLERLFSAVWWDYSNLPFNLNGRICLPASLLFGLAGLLVAYVGVPLAHEMAALVPAIVLEVVALVAVGLLACDFTATVISLSDLMEKISALDVSVNRRADEQLQQAVEALKSTPSQMASAGARTVARARKGRDEVQTRIETARDATVARVQDSVTARRVQLAETASRLSAGQVRLLWQLRRFRSAGLQEKASLLRSTLQQSGDAGEHAEMTGYEADRAAADE